MGIERVGRIEPIYKSKDSTSKRKEDAKSFRECIKKAAENKDKLDISAKSSTYDKESNMEHGGR